MKIAGRWILSSLLVCLLSGCSHPADDAIRFGLASAANNLDPRFATDATSARINRLLYQRLVDFDDQLRPVPSLATWQKTKADVYRFILNANRPDFHDGTPLTANDVAATYRFILDEKNASPHRSTLQLVRHIEVIDQDTLDFHLVRDDPLLPGYLVIGIVPAARIAAGHPLHEDPVGSGPFRFLGWPEPGRVRLSRLSDDQIVEFLRIADPTVRILKLIRGEIDLLQNDVPTELLGYLNEQEGIQVTSVPGSNFSYIGFNLDDPVVGSHDVRLAIAHAIDRHAIIRYVFGEAAQKASALLPPDHWAGNPELGTIQYEPDTARNLLKKAGYDDSHPLKIGYKTSTDPVRVRIATIIQQQLAEVGIDMTLQSYDWGTFYGDIKAGRFQMYSLAWVGIKTPDIFRYAFHSESFPPAGANRGRFNDVLIDGLIDKAGQGGTLDEQAGYYRQVQQRLLDRLPYVPLWYESHVAAIRKDITGYQLARDGSYDDLINIQRLTRK